MGRLATLIDADSRFGVAVGQLLVRAVKIERSIDDVFEEASASVESHGRGWVNAEY